MPRIKFEEYAQNVEACRRTLIDTCISKGYTISKDTSLQNVSNLVSHNIESNKDILVHEVRFFDADGRLVKTEYVEHGGACTPPEVNLDPERLTFWRWASAIGNTFNNITHDVDYGALYRIKDNSNYLFIKLTPSTGLDIKFSFELYYGKVNVIEVDWGDGSDILSAGDATKTTGSGIFNFEHTYNDYGEYIICIKPTVYRDDTVFDETLSYVIENYNEGYYLLGSSAADNALYRLYAPLKVLSGSKNDFEYTNNLLFVVYYRTSSAYYGKERFIILHDTISSTGSGAWKPSDGYTTRYIIDNTNSFGSSFYGYLIPRGTIDKLILPKAKSGYYMVAGTSTGTGSAAFEKVIALSPASVSSRAVTYYEYVGTEYSLRKLAVHELALPTIELTLPSLFLENSTVSFFEIKQNMTFAIDTFNTPNFTNLVLYAAFDKSLNLKNALYLTDNCILNMLNTIINTTNSLTLSFGHLHLYKINTYYVKQINGIYEYCNQQDEGAITMMEAFNNKGWTIS